MSPYMSFIITVLYGDTLLKCGLKLDRGADGVPSDLGEYPMEYRKFLHGLLPLHVQSCGAIVDIEEIFEIHCVSGY
jgi:hypothetical protein